MGGSPSGAVAWNYEVGSDGDQFVECCRQDWFEETSSEMQSSDEPMNVFDSRSGLHVV